MPCIRTANHSQSFDIFQVIFFFVREVIPKKQLEGIQVSSIQSFPEFWRRGSIWFVTTTLV